MRRLTRWRAKAGYPVKSPQSKPWGDCQSGSAIQVSHEAGHLVFQRSLIAHTQTPLYIHPNESEVLGFVRNLKKRSPEWVFFGFMVPRICDLLFIEPIRQFNPDRPAVFQIALDIRRVPQGLSPVSDRTASKQRAVIQECAEYSLLFSRVSHHASALTFAQKNSRIRPERISGHSEIEPGTLRRIGSRQILPGRPAWMAGRFRSDAVANEPAASARAECASGHQSSKRVQTGEPNSSPGISPNTSLIAFPREEFVPGRNCAVAEPSVSSRVSASPSNP